MTGEVLNFPDILELPVFPLPNVVFFPHTVLPFHIFEPRYKQMVSDALEGDRQIGLALLQPGWESKYYGSPDVFTTGGMGLITEHNELEEGKYDILLQGRHRYEIIDFIRQKPYRVARVQLLKDVIPSSQEVSEIATELMLLFRELTEEITSPGLNLDVLEKLDFPSLVNSICSSLNLSVYDKQQLLEMDRLKVRAETALAILRQQVKGKRFVSRFRHLKPEDPSVN
ncbi:LON peptidase substrate-binding domain-containing protein [Acidobacteria bacterium AH-259-A15]|nr:LON peptidase substrate-binding domain-containing protein [Acidobacteria bacterium AH-259-A15]